MNLYRALPSVDRVLAQPMLTESDHNMALITELVREELAEARDGISRGIAPPTAEACAGRVLLRAAALSRPSLRPVINGTGVIIHTNLGRAPLSVAARAAMDAAARGYSNLEFDLESGGRGSRHTHVDALLRRVTGAESGMAVNNAAAALLMTLTALCRERDVVISRGQLVEIGGGFRIPDVLRQSGARLVEVGTTNRTYVRDYEGASGPETAAFLRVHSSNFRQIGFVEQPELAGLAGAAHARDLLLIDDIGSGALLDTATFGLAPEPTVQASIASGADLVIFSGDKLLGGPQAGVIVGRAGLVDQLRRHPLARALRLDKATVAALNATLLHYVQGAAVREIPVWQMIAANPSTLGARARAWAEAIPGARVVVARSMVGGGSLPEESLPTTVLALPVKAAGAVADALRRNDPPIIARVEHDEVLLDPRTVAPEDDAVVTEAVRRVLGGAGG